MLALVLLTGTVLSGAAQAQTAAALSASQPWGQPQQDTGWVEDAIGNMAMRGYSKQQIRDRFAYHGIDLTEGVIDGVVNGTLGVDLGLGRQITNAVLGRNVSGLQNELVNEGILMAEDLIEQSIPPLADLMRGGLCSTVVMDGVAGAASAISGFFSGGRATVVAQGAQQVQLAWANKCNGEMNDRLASLEDYERKNISHGSVNAAPGIDGMLGRITGNLGQGGFLGSEGQVQDSYGRHFPNVFGPMSKEQLVHQDIIWDDTVRDSRMNSFAIQNRSVQEQVRSVGRARDFAAAGRAGPGIRAELQAANAIQAEHVGAINNLTTTIVATNRAATVERMREETTKKAAHASVDEYMASLAQCSNCTISTPFLKP
jgi:hypothetical protein